MAIKQQLVVGAEVPDLAGVMHRVIADRSAEGFDDTPPIVALCLGINNRSGTEWVKTNNPNFGFDNEDLIYTIAQLGTEYLAFGTSSVTDLAFIKSSLSDSKEINRNQNWTQVKHFSTQFTNRVIRSSLVVQNGSSSYLLLGANSGKIYSLADSLANSIETNTEGVFLENESIISLLQVKETETSQTNRIYAFSNTREIAWADPSDLEGGWTLVPQNTGIPTEVSFASVAYGNGKFVAVGNSGFLATSKNCMDWEILDSKFETSDIRDVYFANSIWVAVGQSGKISYSEDNGANWKKVNNTGFGTTRINSVSFGNNTWIAVGDAGKICYSRDAKTWNTIDTASFEGSQGFANLHFVIFSGGKWVAGGSQGIIASSVTGVGRDAGVLRYFDKDGTAGSLTYLNLDINITDVPPHDYDKSFKIAQGKTYLTRAGKKVYAESVVDDYTFKMRPMDGWASDNFLAGIVAAITSYNVWYTGRRYADKTDSSDIIEEWKDPVEVFRFVIADKYDPFNKSTWGSQQSSIQTLFNLPLPNGKTRYQVHMREIISDTETFKLILDGES